jgi:nitrate reductase gamma subunit
MTHLFSVFIPCAAAIVFLVGIVRRLMLWAASPVPFRIPIACGQQKSLPWIKSSRLENPHTLLGVIGRMALEILLFRSLFRNTRAELKQGPALIHGSAKWLWVGALAFHWSLLVVLIRHVRFVVGPELGFVMALQNLDGFFQIGLPVLFVSDVLLTGAVVYLLLRRIVDSRVRYISLAADYVPLLLIGSIAGTGIWMRHVDKVDLYQVKEFALSMMRLRPSSPQGVGLIFYLHLFLVSMLIAYIPFSKLMHMGGVFLSPTRNLANNNRMRRHVNPWNYDVRVHTYEEYEDEFRNVMISAGLPVEKDVDPQR